tara:strand:- start:250 stop:447 length:198 start_codon:yes stop_codon:yes gene_type:complete
MGNLLNMLLNTHGHLLIGGEDGIRTHVPGYPDQLISSQRRYDHFGTSPFVEHDFISFITPVYNER